MFCSNCGKELPDGAMFCSSCGKAMNTTQAQPNAQTDNSPSVQSKATFNNTVKKVIDNDFVKSVKNDIGNSQSINMIKDKATTVVENAKTNNTKGKFNTKIIAIIAAVVVAVIVIVANLHTCEECEELYFGEKNIINFWGEYAEVCDDCYRDYYSW